MIIPVLCCIIKLVFDEDTYWIIQVIFPVAEVFVILTVGSNCNTKVIPLTGRPDYNWTIIE